MAINRLATVRGGGESSFGNRLLFPDGGPTADLELFCSGAEVLGGKGEPLQPTVFSFLVFDVDRHVAVDLGEGAQEPGPVLDVVADADGNEPPRGTVRPRGSPEADSCGDLVQRINASNSCEVLNLLASSWPCTHEFALTSTN
jgi:hypothetical protein